MKRLENNLGLKKGDIITMRENCIISHGAGTPDQYFEDVLFTHKFMVVRVNKKTYLCRYTEGAHSGCAFGWYMTNELPGEVEYYL